MANDPTPLANNKGPSSSIIQRIANHCLLCGLLKNHLNVLLWVVLCSGCINVFCNPFENRYNLKNLADNGIGSKIYNLFMLHTSWLLLGYVPMEKWEQDVGVHELK
jgi:hypothetical protein